MTMHTYTRRFIIAALGFSILVPSFTFAQDLGASAAVNAQATTSVRTSLMTRAIERADQEIDRRITTLQRFNARVQSMRKVTTEFKNNLSANIQGHIDGLATLKAKIDADTDATTLRADVLTIRQAYRVFALIMPQAAIASASDRIVNVVDMIVGVGNKLQARIEEARTAGRESRMERERLW